MVDIESRYYLRFDVADQPGVLATIATALGDRGVSVEQMLQEGARGEEVPVLIITHEAREGAVRAAVALVESSPWLKHPPRMIRIEDL